MYGVGVMVWWMEGWLTLWPLVLRGLALQAGGEEGVAQQCHSLKHAVR